MNNLTTQAGLKIGPVVLETLVKHYFDRLKTKAPAEDNPVTQLRQEELLYDQAFNIVKAFLKVSSYNTVEEVQAFANTRTPSPPWVHVVRLVVPVSCCDDAAQYLITALGGADATQKLVGGCKWWQVRGIPGVDAQWITAKKDWQEAKRRYKMYHNSRSMNEAPVDPDADSAPYEEHMDEMRCILYAHGGGYYFGSVDQERYSLQRHARKINGRIFAINYRLAPQYPFPCALQDLLAAYLYLIRPPHGASHRPVKPAHLVVAGDSAGGGLTLALLQIIRDTGLPLPAGGVLISPWCDLTHSFPSIHTNTATDVIPEYGLSLHKPSSLWPPPSEAMSRRVHASLRTWIRKTLNHDSPRPQSPPSNPADASTSTTSSAVPAAPVSPIADAEATKPLPPLPRDVTEVLTLTAKSGEELRIDRQVHLYAQNSLLVHPLISSAVGFLGGLPPLLFIASDKEVLRDEIIYTAHRAANPERYPVRDETRAMYSPLDGIEKRFGPTKVHLQVYDDTAHILPVLFSFTTPGKFCYRAVATFCREVTGMKHPPPSQSSVLVTPRHEKKYSLSQLPPLPPSPFPSTPAADSGAHHAVRNKTPAVPKEKGPQRSKSVLVSKRRSLMRTSTLPTIKSESPALPPKSGPNVLVSKRRSEMRMSTVKSDSPDVPPKSEPKSVLVTKRRTSTLPPVKSESPDLPPKSEPKVVATSTDASAGGGSYFHPSRGTKTPPTASDEEDGWTLVVTPPLVGERTAGEPSIYAGSEWKKSVVMIRERVSTRGVLRPLEPEADLIAFTVAPENVGVVSEPAVRRFLEGTQRFDRKFASAIKAVEKSRQRNLERANKDTVRNMSVLQNFIGREADATVAGGAEGRKTDKTVMGLKDGLLASSGWSWAWALDVNENPPPSSIVSRRDTQEALRLARIADQTMMEGDEHAMSGNHLWSVVINFLNATSDKSKKSEDGVVDKPLTRKSTLSRMFPKETTTPK
ncbi:hypothetical protein B0H15DRAFT_820712 [Mycena belliarum]|uniref:Alpha/beta hydrolase fold-3 domain-containing protein n=1 Tax=Mycena belliarum TaxID=1033014 RepID=A0AAD6UI42_9AGAR|nr:hypothetical protein B0H15DRAFT_820712 [Mycena belliae]